MVEHTRSCVGRIVSTNVPVNLGVFESGVVYNEQSTFNKIEKLILRNVKGRRQRDRSANRKDGPAHIDKRRW